MCSPFSQSQTLSHTQPRLRVSTLSFIRDLCGVAVDCAHRALHRHHTPTEFIQFLHPPPASSSTRHASCHTRRDPSRAATVYVKALYGRVIKAMPYPNPSCPKRNKPVTRVNAHTHHRTRRSRSRRQKCDARSVSVLAQRACTPPLRAMKASWRCETCT